MLTANDPRLDWRGHISLEPVGVTSLRPWRVPFVDRDLFPGVNDKAAQPAGVRVAVVTDAAWLVVHADVTGQRLRPVEGQAVYLDVVVGDDVVPAEPGQRVELPGGGTREVEVWLPHFAACVLHGLELPAGAHVGRAVSDRPVWLTYGSSITQAADAFGPARTWPARVARAEGYDLTCLGYGGQCKLDPMVARMIRDRHADYLSVCSGINIRHTAMDLRVYEAALIGTVETIREGHADTPLVLISPVLSPPREASQPDAYGLEDMRVVCRDVAARLRSRGDEALHYVDGLTIFSGSDVPAGQTLRDLMPDDLHPNDTAQPTLAGNFRRHVVRACFSGGGADVE